MPASRTK